MKIGFIGAGNMGGAIIDGLIAVGNKDIVACDLNNEKLNSLKEKGIDTTKDLNEVCEKCDVVVLAVKPQVFDSVLSQIKIKTPIFVSIAAGISLSYLAEALGKKAKIVRAMPNTPALIGKGVTVLSPGGNVTKEETDLVKGIFDAVGITEVMAENLMDAVVAASGSSPAYIYMMIEAMADGAVAQGIRRDVAYKLCASTVLGSAEMVLKTGMHPGQLKDMVCSPGGTTIDAVASLEEDGFRAAVINAMEKCAKKSKELTR